MIGTRLRSLIVGVACAVAPSGAHGQPAAPAPYSVDRFGTDAGIPGNQVYDLAQTADGYLWVATNGGLARFDGIRFEDLTARLQPTLESAIITDLFVGRGDTLFAAATGGPGRGSHVLAHGGGALAYHGGAMPSGGNIGNVVQDAAGRLFATAAERLFRVGPSRVEERSARTPEGLHIRKLAADRQGRMVALLSAPAAPVAGGLCGSVSVGPWWFGQIGDGRPVRGGASAFGHFVWGAADGEVLRSRRDGGATHFATMAGRDRGRFEVPPGACPVLIGRDGVLWAQEGAALVAYAPRRAEALVRLDLGLSLNATPVFLEDREGTLWVASTTQGLLRIRRDLFRVVATTDVPDEAPVRIYPGADGSTLLIDAMNRAFRVGRDGRPVQLRTAGRPLRANGLYEDADGNRLYAQGEADSTRLYREVGGVSRLLITYPGRGSRNGARFLPDPSGDGSVWVYEGLRIYRVADPWGPAPALTLVRRNLPPARHLHIDRRGVLWVGTEGGLLRLDGGRETRFTTADGLPHDHVRYVHEDADGTLWLGTYGGGLARYREGRFRAVRAADGLAEDIVSSILEDASGVFWMSGNRGVHRTSRSELNAFLDGDRARVASVLHGRASGLVNPEATGTPGIVGGDGRLWFPTFFGAAVVDPEVARRLDVAPPLVHVETVSAGDATLRAGAAPLRLTADQRRFTVGYVGLSLRHPEAVRYRYRLDGFDADWVEAGTARRATYTNVSPGDYTFRVQAQSFGGVWSEADGEVALSVAPFFYETGWFYALCFVVLGGLVVGGARARERQLRGREAELNALVRERTDALRQEKEIVAAQAEALRSLDEAKSRVFANISHEFRTPLTLILGPLEDLQDDLQRGVVGANASRRVGSAIGNARRLLRLVNQLLDVSRLEAGGVEIEAADTDVAALVRAVARAFEPLAERARMTLHMDLHPARAFLDAEQMEKVVVNLLGNAFKFTPAGGTVGVTLRTEADDGVVLAVADDGPGISDEHQRRIFERFFQADASSTRRKAGTGIGLALARSIVELHRGTLTVESAPGEGSTFTVRLPPGTALPAGGPAASPGRHLSSSRPAGGGDGLAGTLADLALAPDRAEPAPASDPDAATVLIVDDNPEIRAYVREHLGVRYRMLEAGDGREALACARERRPDCIVSDVMMPDLDGFGLVRAVREDPELDFVPVVLLTARASAESKLEGLALGAEDYLTKPFDVRELEVRVENLIASRQRLKAHVAAGLPADAPAPDLDPFLAEVRAAIATRLADDDFGVDALAAALGLGRSTLYRRLGEAGGPPPMDLVWQMRLETAADLLRQRSGTVGEVAYGVGFKSVAHFCTRFLETYGVTPATYAAEHAT